MHYYTRNLGHLSGQKVLVVRGANSSCGCQRWSAWRKGGWSKHVLLDDAKLNQNVNILGASDIMNRIKGRFDYGICPNRKWKEIEQQKVDNFYSWGGSHALQMNFVTGNDWLQTIFGFIGRKLGVWDESRWKASTCYYESYNQEIQCARGIPCRRRLWRDWYPEFFPIENSIGWHAESIVSAIVGKMKEKAESWSEKGWNGQA